MHSLLKQYYPLFIGVNLGFDTWFSFKNWKNIARVADFREHFMFISYNYCKDITGIHYCYVYFCLTNKKYDFVEYMCILSLFILTKCNSFRSIAYVVRLSDMAYFDRCGIRFISF